MMNKLHSRGILLSLFFLTGLSFSAPPPLRDQISLNGVWDFTPDGGVAKKMPVPEYWDGPVGLTNGVRQATYERDVSVPASMAGKRVKVEFEGVSYVADVFVNGTLVGNHIGPFIPFSFDITHLVTPGQSFRLKVHVKGGGLAPVLDANGNSLWPNAWYGHQMNWGINYNTWLRAYGVVHIEDTYIITSFRTKKITTRHYLSNKAASAKTVRIKTEAVNPETQQVELSFITASITLPSNGIDSIETSALWNNPTLWNPYPGKPHLYHLRSTVIENSDTLDRETRRFGFREIWIEGNQYKFNGVRLNLYGDNINEHMQRQGAGIVRPENWAKTVDTYLANNIRYLRFHQAPGDPYMIQTCDEKGLMILDESPMYGRPYVPNSDKPKYIANSLIWIKGWIKARRSWPSIIQWSAQNEMTYGEFGGFSAAQVALWADEIRKYDKTRPVSHDGTNDPMDNEVLNIHYPEGYQMSWDNHNPGFDGLPRDLKNLPLKKPQKPNGIGEFLTNYGARAEANKWWQGTAIRGLRYTGWTDVRPYRMNWVQDDSNANTPRLQNLKNSFALVALFDRYYDSLGIAPVMSKTYPSLSEGTTANRSLTLYNEEFADSIVIIEVQLKSGDKLYASATRQFTVTSGEHVVIPYSFQVPDLGGKELEVHLRTYKGALTLKFSEVIRFKVTENGFAGTVSDAISITGGSAVGIKEPQGWRPDISLSENAAPRVLNVSATGLAFALPADHECVISLYSGAGKQVFTSRPFVGKRGVNNFRFNKKIGQGIYLVSVKSGKISVFAKKTVTN